MPISIVSSVAFHAALFGLLAPAGPSSVDDKVVADVDLMIQMRKAVPAAPKTPVSPRAVKPPSTFDFLKMALPTRTPSPRGAAPKALEIAAPQIRRAQQFQLPEKLVDRGRRAQGTELKALDLGKRRTQAADLEIKPVVTRRVAAMAALPRLEEVGRRQVKNLPQAIALEEKRREAVVLKGIQSLAPNTRRAPVAAQAVLREATPPEHKRLGGGLDSILPVRERISIAPQEPPAVKTPIKKIEAAAPIQRRKAEALGLGQKKKAVEIEGPLADRDVVYYEIPKFPDWAREAGIDEASVAIRFSVDRAGDVLPGMRVETTSGFGRLDRLAMASLERWKFAPEAVQQRQWGIITFRFVLE